MNDAYDAMRRELGPDAVVLRTAQVKEGGILGFLGRKRVELTVSTCDEGTQRRKLSAAERKYARENRSTATENLETSASVASAATPAMNAVGSDERISSTIAHFQRKIQEAAQRSTFTEDLHTARTIRAELRESAAKPQAASPGANPSAFAGGRGQAAPAVEPASDVLPFKRPQQEDDPLEIMRRELREIREGLDMLVAETPGAGLPAEVSPYYRDLIARGVPRKLAASILGKVYRECSLPVIQSQQAFTERLRAEVARRITVTGGIELTPGTCKVVAFVGATGVGKTTNLAKLAAHYALRRHARVALITSDTYRIAAPQQLKVYADIVGLPMKVVNDGREMAEALRVFRDYELVLVDTPGGSQFNVRHLQEVRSILSVAQPHEVILALPVGAQLDDLCQAVENFRCLKPTSILFSKLDETRKFGAMLAIVMETGWPASYLSVGQDVPNDIRTAQPDAMASLVVEGINKRERSS